MDFIVSRTSRYSGKDYGQGPCDEAKIKTVTVIDDRAIPSLAEVAKEDWGPKWLRTGKNHKEMFSPLQGHFVSRDVISKYWVVEIASLEGLCAFVKEHKRIVITKTDIRECLYELEIYDQERE